MTPRKPIPHRRPKKPRKTCATPRCVRPPGHGQFGTFCRVCADRLATVADAIASEGHKMHKGGLDPAAAHRIVKPRIKRIPTCCTIGCYAPRVPPDAFCDGCIQSGAIQEDN